MHRIVEANFFPPPVEQGKEKSRILIIDNNSGFTYAAKIALERTGRYFVCEENEAAWAHQTAQEVRPDLILLDIAIAEADGRKVATQIESDPALRGTSIVFLTPPVTKTAETSGDRIQGHPFLTKPISIPELIAGIERNLPALAH
jgi:CheY-like chemotaxis protein